MAYKVNDNNIIFDSDGKTVLVTNSEILFDGTNTVGNTLYDLSDTDFIDLFKFPAQGTESGYRSAGRSPALANNINTIDKYPFSTDANATDVGDLAQSRQLPAGQSSNTHGYTSGGLRGSPPFSPPYNSSVIDKFSLILKGLFILVTYLTFLLSVNFVESDEYYQGEYYFLLLSSLLGELVVTSSRELLTMFIGI